MSSTEQPRFVRLFPLPDIVMFPHALQTFYMFEPRYVQLVKDALESDRTICMALLKSGWEAEYDHSPAIHETVCLCRIVSYAENDKQHYNLLLAGENRARIAQEIEDSSLYRKAEVELIEQTEADDSTSWGLQSLLCQRLRDVLMHTQIADELLDDLNSESFQLSKLVDVISFAMPMDLEVKQALLSEQNVECRVQCLLEYMAIHGTAISSLNGKSPPDYSLN